MFRVLILLVLAVLGSQSAAALIDSGRLEWTEYRNERYGLTMRYPSAVFQSQRGSVSGDGDLFETQDGRARLLVGSLPNPDGFTPRSYQAFIARESYPGLKVDYAPIRETWTVLSGTVSDTMIYEKAMFTCGGKRISTFAMTYPVDERSFYDRIVEVVEHTFRPSPIGCDRDGSPF